MPTRTSRGPCRPVFLRVQSTEQPRDEEHDAAQNGDQAEFIKLSWFIRKSAAEKAVRRANDAVGRDQGWDSNEQPEDQMHDGHLESVLGFKLTAKSNYAGLPDGGSSRLDRGAAGCGCQKPWPIQSSNRHRRNVASGTPARIASACGLRVVGSKTSVAAQPANHAKNNTQPILAMPRRSVSMFRLHPVTGL
jgi:hypothetical protein